MPTYSPGQLGIQAPQGGFQTGGWYSGRQYWNGTLSDPGVIHPESNQQGAGQQVSDEVVEQTNQDQGLASGTNQQYIVQQQQQQRTGTSSSGVNLGQTSYGQNSGQLGSGQVNSGQAGIGQQPSLDLQAIYDQAFQSPEIDTANAEISDVQAEIDATQQAYDEAEAGIKDNPMYSVATLTGKVSKAHDKFNADLNRLQNKKAIAENKLATLKAEAEIKVNIATKQYDIDRQEYQDQLSLFSSLLDAGALANASTATIAQYAVATGIPVEMIQNIINRQKKDDISPQVITSTDDNGNVTVSIIDINTGEIMSKTSLGQVDQSKSSSGSTKEDERVQNIQTMIIDMQNGATLQALKNYYGSIGGIDDETIFNYYNQYSSNGKAKETFEEFKAGDFVNLREE